MVPPTGNIHRFRVMGDMLRLLPINRVYPIYGFANWQRGKNRACDHFSFRRVTNTHARARAFYTSLGR